MIFRKSFYANELHNEVVNCEVAFVAGRELISACPLVTILPSQQLSSAAAAAVAAAAGVWPPSSLDDMPHKGKRLLLLYHFHLLLAFCKRRRVCVILFLEQ